MQHLWEVDHPYYCSDHNYYSNDCTQEFRSWQAFAEEYGDADLDYNLVFRWDWHKATKENELPNDELQVCIMQQRKGRFVVALVNVHDEDEPAVLDYLRVRKAHMDKLWLPLWSGIPEESQPQGRREA